MEYGILDLIKLIGSLGFFIYGMKVMSEGIQKAAGDRLRVILGTMTKNRYLGVISGFLITALVQSSSATTVMTVSFVNAGLLSLLQSAGIMMGANVGTTITGWLISSLGFEVKIATLSLPIIAVALPMMFIRKGTTRFWAEFLIGFALLFMGLDFLKAAVPDIKTNPDLLAFVQGFTDLGYLSYLFFIFLGTLLTVIVQSSSASMTITLVLVAQGWIPFDIAAALVLGENIGTTITAQIASIVGNVHAKRSARIHFMFNVFGVTWMLLVFPFFINLIDFITDFLGYGSPIKYTTSGIDITSLDVTETANRKKAVTYGLSIFHTMFNVTNVIILVGFAHKIAAIAEKMVKPKGEDDEKYSLEYIGGGITSSVELSLLEAKKEISKFGGLIIKMMNKLDSLILETKPENIKKSVKKIRKYEDITDNIEIEISKYLIQVSESELSQKSSEKIRAMLSMISDLEQLGDIIYQMSRTIDRKNEEKIWFTPAQRNNVKEMFEKINAALQLMQNSISGDYEAADLNDAKKIEKEINSLRGKFRKEHLKSIEKGYYNIQAGLVYVDLISSAEKLGDHILNVTEAAKGEHIE